MNCGFPLSSHQVPPPFVPAWPWWHLVPGQGGPGEGRAGADDTGGTPGLSCDMAFGSAP